MAGVKGCSRIDLGYTAPLCRIGVLDVSRLYDPRTVHENVESAKAVDRSCNRVRGDAFLGHIARERQARPAGRLDCPDGVSQTFGATRHRDHRGARGPQRDRGRRTDPGRSAGHQRYPPRQRTCHAIALLGRLNVMLRSIQAV